MTSTPGILPNCASTLKTPLSMQADQASKEASYPVLIPLSPNYFDVLSEEEDAPPEGTLERERESPGLHKALALSPDPKEKVPMSLQEQTAEAEEAELQLALRLSRAEAQKPRMTQPYEQKEAAGWTMSSTVGRTMSRACGSTTRITPPLDLRPTLPTSSRTRSPTALPPHLERRLETTKKTLPRSLVPCKSVHLGPRAGRGTQAQ